MNMIKTDSLMVHYGDKKVLSGVFFQLREGEITSIVGRNGCGKSTLIKAMCGLLSQSRESLFVEGVYVVKEDRGKYIAYLPQETFLPANAKVRTVLKIYGIFHECDERIESFIDKKTATLSAGELRYLEITLASSLDRKAYFFDEPFSGIEPIYIEQIKKKLIELKDRRKYVLVTDHDYHSVKDVSDKMWLSRSGRMTQVKENDEFLIGQGYLPDKNRSL